MLARRIHGTSITLVVAGLFASAFSAACSSSQDTPGPISVIPDAGPVVHQDAADNVPEAPSATDGKKDGSETDVDCGGGQAAKCANGKTCSVGPDCVDSACTANVCTAPTATDNVKNGTETDKDCGGRNAPPCASGLRCKLHVDCISSACIGGVCQPASASDGIQNGTETDVDCGGGAAPVCAPTKACKTFADCTSSCTNLVCDDPSDHDLKLNNGETDIDCGGPTAKKCGVGKTCGVGTDCGLGDCFQIKCVTPTGSDGRKNGTETDVDCGGAAQSYDGVTVPAAPGCAATKVCGADSDCASLVCATSNLCVEAASCRPIHGGQSCGLGEYGAPDAKHESCCKSLPVPGVTAVLNGQSRKIELDKYEITAGRVRTWIAAIKAQYGGVPNIQEWVRQRRQTDSILADMIPADLLGYLPSQLKDQPITDGNGAVVNFAVYPPFTNTPGNEFYQQTTTTINAGLWSQLGPTSYYRGVTSAGTSGCSMNAGGYGHRTYYIDDATEPGFAAYFGNFEVLRAKARNDDLDEKSMNCMTPLMFAAFCAWDGGYIMSQASLIAAYGTGTWPWGDSPTASGMNSVAGERTFPGNFNYSVNSTPFTNTRRPAYNYPVLQDSTWSSDFTPLIAAPGRFAGDVASISRPGQADTWMDLGGNMIEWSTTAGANYWGWTGASWEGHVYPRTWTSGLNRLDKYGKGSSRCMRLK